MPEGLIDGRAKADVAIVRDHADPALRLYRAPAAIVHHDHFEIRECLTIQRSQTFVKCFIRRERRNNHGHRWGDFAGLRFCVPFQVLAPGPIHALAIVVCIDTYYTFSLSGGLFAQIAPHLGDIQQLTFGGQNAEAYWSPDGKRMIFQSTRDKLQCDQIFIMNADGSNQHMVSTGKGRTTCGYFLAGQQAHPVRVDTRGRGRLSPGRGSQQRLRMGRLSRLRNLSCHGRRQDSKEAHVGAGLQRRSTVNWKTGKIVYTSMQSGDLDLWTMKPDGSGQEATDQDRRLRRRPGVLPRRQETGVARESSGARPRLKSDITNC